MNLRCKHCWSNIQLINIGIGWYWAHVDSFAVEPSFEEGTMWKHCRITTAEPANV